MVPSALGVLNKTGVEWLLEAGAGAAAGFPDSEYAAKGVRLAAGRGEVFASADVILQVRSPGANPETAPPATWPCFAAGRRSSASANRSPRSKPRATWPTAA